MRDREARAAELADQIIRAQAWALSVAPRMDGFERAIRTVAEGARSYAPDADPSIVGRILIGVAATAAHLPDSSLPVVMNMIATAGAELISESETHS